MKLNETLDRPITTLFLLMSVDGKISTDSSDELDFDRDFPNIEGLKEGRVQRKMGVNDSTQVLPDKTEVSYVIFDNTNLTEQGIRYFCALSKTFVLVTSNIGHPAFDVQADNMSIILYNELNLTEILKSLKTDYGCDRLTIQTDGIINSLLLKEKLIDYVDIIVAPVLVGGKDTSTLVDGKSLTQLSQLSELGIFELIKAEPLNNSYLRLQCRVIV